MLEEITILFHMTTPHGCHGLSGCMPMVTIVLTHDSTANIEFSTKVLFYVFALDSTVIADFNYSQKALFYAYNAICLVSLKG